MLVRAKKKDKPYYAFEDTCNYEKIKYWVLKKNLFDTLVTQILLYRVEVWGSSTLNLLEESFKMS